MGATLNMAQSLLELGRTQFQHHHYQAAARLLQRVLELPELSPTIAAEANLLLARIHFHEAQYDQARETLGNALSHDPGSAEGHYLLGRALEHDEETEPADVLAYFESASRLAPHDGAKSSAYALRLARTQAPEDGLRLLEESYRTHGDDPIVVEHFVEGLVENRRHDDVELVLAQVSYRHGDNPRFRRLRQRTVQRLREERLFGRSPSTGRRPRHVLPFRNFSDDLPQRKPRGPKPPKIRPNADSASSSQWHSEAPPAPLRLQQESSLKEILKGAGRAYTQRVYHELGLMGKSRPDHQRAAVCTVLMEKAFLASLVRRLPAASRKLLRTVVAAGGFVPMTVLFQNTGPDAPPPDYAQPLVACGLVYFGLDGTHRRRGNPPSVAVIPVDLLHKLASLLRIHFDD